MVNKATVVVGGVAGFIVLFYFWISTQSYTNSSDGYFSSSSYVDNTHFMPEGWNGLPVSINNNLYLNESKETKFYQKQLLKEIMNLPIDDWENDNWLWLLDYYVPLIGWNGFTDALGDSKHLGLKPNAYVYHHVGELIGEAAAEPEFAIELTARNTMHKSPLHGAVWSLITDYPYTNDPSTLFDYVDHRLCYFRDQKEMFNIWISCAHGVGHGLAKVYLHNIDLGLEVCAQHYDNDFAYSCGTGIFMDTQGELDPLAAAPCDTVKLSASCWRYKGKYFSKNGRDAPNCVDMAPLNQRGCIFGESHELADSVEDGVVFCNKYKPVTEPDETDRDWRNYMTCLEGSWQSNRVYELDDPIAFCQQFPAIIQKICQPHTIPIGEGDDEKWNYNLLEVL